MSACSDGLGELFDDDPEFSRCDDNELLDRISIVSRRWANGNPKILGELGEMLVTARRKRDVVEVSR